MIDGLGLVQSLRVGIFDEVIELFNNLIDKITNKSIWEEC